MPSRTYGGPKRGKKLRFPPDSEAVESPSSGPRETLTRHHNMASQTDQASCEVSSPPGIPEVMAAISSCQAAVATCQTTLTTKIEAVQLDVGRLRQDLDKIRSRVTEAEQRVGVVEDTVSGHEASIRTLTTRVKVLEYRAEDAENRSRRNNIRIVGLPEGAEGRNPTTFTEDLFRSLLPAARLSPYFTVERAHRVPPRPGPEGAPPRTFILRLMNFRDRDELLRAARQAGKLPYRNTNLMMFPDYTVETQRQRRSFDGVKAALRAKGVAYSVLFPAKLRVIDGESVRIFTNPKEAGAWVETLPP